MEEGYNVSQCQQQTVVLEGEEKEKWMKFQGINHEFHVQVISLLFYTPENPFKMLNKQTKVQANKGTG